MRMGFIFLTLEFTPKLSDLAVIELDQVVPEERYRLLEDVAGIEGVKYVEPEVRVQEQAYSTNDPQFSMQWSHKKIESEKARAMAEGGEEVVVAVVDGGVDTFHPDLQANLWRNPREVANGRNDDPAYNRFVDDIHGWDSCDNDGDPRSEISNDNHGTHVAGIIGSVIGNGLGVAGHGKNIKIMALRTMNIWVYRKQRSTWGVKNVDVAAPGTSILAPVNNRAYGYKSGTSMAAPVASGLAAMIRSVRPDLSPEQVIDIIKSLVDKSNYLSTKVGSGGRLNAYKAMRLARTYKTAQRLSSL